MSMMLRAKTVFFVVGVLAVCCCTAPHTSFAQTSGAPNCNQTYSSGFIPLACYSNSPLIQQAFSDPNGLPGYINSVFTIVVSIGAILAVLRIAYGGYLYMGSADMWGNKQQAKEVISDAVIGLLLLLAIYLILNQINPNLLNLNVRNDITPLQAPPAAQQPCGGLCNGGGAGGSFNAVDNTTPGANPDNPFQGTGYSGGS
jgi:hypothetical protein